MWDPKPGGFKGTRLQWGQVKDEYEKNYNQFYKTGSFKQLTDTEKIKHYDNTINKYPEPK